MTDQPPQPEPPREPDLPEGDPRTLLAQRVRAALMVLPGFFEFGTNFEGIDATDLFALNSVLGASIEGQVVRTLNKMRTEWDPDERWTGYRFVRQSQTFPDVLLARRGADSVEIAMGIELKGWYLLSKEGVGSFRFQVTPGGVLDIRPDHDRPVAAQQHNVRNSGRWRTLDHVGSVRRRAS